MMNKTTFFFLRLPAAMSMIGHGAVRIPKLKAFAEGMANSMEKSFLPQVLVTAWGYVLPFIELTLGILLLIGFRPRTTINANLALMAILIFGSASIENWGAVQAQLIHGIYFFALLWYWERNCTANTAAG